MGSHISEESHGKGIRAAWVKFQLGKLYEINVGKTNGKKGLLSSRETVHASSQGAGGLADLDCLQLYQVG